ncbi:DUF4190 domain-containing protein [Tenacibaculum sp. S7007]|uniref:DUF4190 domain-containing protein n=1 Tax=Tenacibaculum pelagium TaxID=2759527 RepID=A0A839AN79_9FLAO|nr:CCC motif membrane protein [Tenacibaculum pelagium]MBA6155191.1 DUF4190 domain-containing protein [Tenacibaculum pelagium]
MEKEQLPNSTIIIILGVLSILGSCCFGGALGLIMGITALILAKKAKNTYNETPELYEGLSNVNTGKILAIIGIILSLIIIAMVIFIGMYFGWDVISNPELLNERLEDMQ